MAEAGRGNRSSDKYSDARKRGPLVVDLEGTLVHTDSLCEAVIAPARESPWSVYWLPFWLIRGKEAFKHRIAARVPVDASSSPYEPELVDWLRSEREAGRPIVLATASNLECAEAVAEHLGFFDEIFASDEQKNLAGLPGVLVLN